MTERLSDEQVAHGVTPCYPGFTNDLAREVQQWRARYGSLDEAFTVDDLKQIYANHERLMALDALIPEVIEQLETLLQPDPPSSWHAVDAIIARLREATQ